MLTLVAGPTNVIDPVGPSATVCSQGRSLWVEGMGLAFAASSSNTGGSMYLCNSDGYAVYTDQLGVTGAMGWDYLKNPYGGGPVFFSGTWKLFLPAAAPQNGKPDYPGGGSYQTPSAGYAILANRTLVMSSNYLEVAQPPAFQTTTNECPLPALMSAQFCGNNQIHPYQLDATHSLWYACNPANGIIALYDAIAKAFVPGTTTQVAVSGTNSSIAYSAKLNLFFVLNYNGTNTTLSIYANDPVAASLSAPAFVSSPVQGEVVGVTTTILGALGEPCVGRAVTFTATVGTFQQATVATNSAGVATAYFVAPLTTSVGASCTATLLE